MPAASRTTRTTTMPLTHGGVDRPAFIGMGRRFLRGVSVLVIAALLNTSLMPLVQAAEIKKRKDAAAEAVAATTSDETRYAQALQGPYAPDADALDTLAGKLQTQWGDLRARWQAAGVSSEIIERQNAIEQNFRTHHQQLQTLLRAAQAPGAGAAEKAALADFLNRERPRQAHLPINLQNMPWQVQKPVKTEPATTDDALNKKLSLGASATPAPAQQKAAAATTTAPLKSLPTSTPADLAPTLDAPQTADIKQLAQSLNNDPLKIYQWVHDNIYYFPSQGSVQGAQDTLDKKRGNAIDTASLLIAMLRSAGIPARYVYGTVEMPIDKAMNWVGGAKTGDAAQQILGQGGVPTVQLTSGGKVVAMRLEHVWVEALIQYNPGRGAKHIQGQSVPDAWVPMDASFKQYTFAQGMDLQAAVPLDAQALITAAQQGATVNEQEGWVQNLNQAAVQSQLNAYQNQLKNYINSQNGGNSTVGDVLGTRQAQIDPLPYFAGTLPYTLKARSQQFSEVPDSLRAKFRYVIYPDQRSAAWGDSPILSYQAPTASLAGKKLTLSWVAANEAIQAAILAMIPTPPPGQELDPSQLPRGLSSSIALTPTIRLDGQTVATGSAMSVGSEPVGAGAFTKYGSQQWDETQDQLIVGQQSALGLSIQGISQKQLETLKTRMDAMKAKLQQAQAAPQDQRAAILQGMTGENFTGDILTTTIWDYFAILQNNGDIASAKAETFDLPALNYGLFHAQVRPNKLYGLVTTGITFEGFNLDIGHLRHMRWVKDDNLASPINNKPELTANGKSAAQNRWIAYNKMRGQYASAMEYAAPEQVLVDRSSCRYIDETGNVKNPTLEPCTEAISAVKAIAIAQNEGQKIYTITPQNAVTALPKLPVGGDVGDEIRNAVQAGKEVMVHERAISANGWTGYGYSIIDPDTGVGAYLIEGKGNGSFIAQIILTIVGIVLFFTGVGEVAAILLLILKILTVFLAFYNILLNAIAILDKGGKCSVKASEIYLALFVPIALIALILPPIFGVQNGAVSLMMRLIPVMYGSDLYSGVAGSKACQ